MMYRRVSVPFTKLACVGLLLLLVLPGCATRPGAPRAMVVEDPPSKRSPFTFSVDQEMRDEAALYLSGQIGSEVPWNPHRVGIRIRLIHEGEEVAQQVKPMADFLPVVERTLYVAADERVPYSIVVAAPPFSDYLAEVLWGEDFDSAVAPPPVQLEVLEIIKEQQPGCDTAQCRQRFAVEASVFNRSTQLQDNLAVLVGLEERASHSVVGRKRRVSVPVQLPPGELKKLTFRFSTYRDPKELARLEPVLTMARD